MSDNSKKVYEFGPFRVDTAERILLRNGQPVPLTLKAFDVLLLLVEKHDHIVEKDELMRRVWAGSFVEEGNLKVTVSMLRKALDDNHDDQRFIETVPRRGYRFVAKVEEITAESIDLVWHEHTRETLTVDEVVAQPARSDTYRLHNAKQHRLAIAAVGIVVFALSTAIVFFGLKYPRLTARDSRAPFIDFRITSLTTSGRALDAAISPDGKYLAYVAIEGTQRRLWMRHISTASDVQIAGPGDGSFGGLVFSPSGDYLYYVSGNFRIPISLFQVPVLGGTPRKLITDIDSAVTISPDGKQLAFMRGYPPQQEAYLVVANLDGTGERKLVTHHLGELFLNGPNELRPSWSPDGEMIAFPFSNYRAGVSGATLMIVGVKDGVEKLVAFGPWQTIGPISWMRDGSGLVFIAAEQGPEVNGQIWFVSYPSSNVRRITNDLNNYHSLSLSADSSALITIQNQQTSNLWTASSRYDDAVQISSGRYDGRDGLSWTPDGRLVYVSRTSGQPQIWIANADGTDKKQLTFDSSWKGRLDVSPDGRYIVFASGRTDLSHIWRMDIGGGNEVQLSRGRENRMPQVSFDSRWVVYTCFDGGSPRLWKVPLTGGEPVQVTNYQSALVAISPQDGQIAYSYEVRDEPSGPSRRVALVPLSGGIPGRTVDFLVPQNSSAWAADGRALTYIESRSGVSNIWNQPIDGGPAKQITNFTSQRIFRHDWSSDGKRLALARGSWSSDVVLIRDLPHAK